MEPCISAETVKTCSLIGMMTEENARRSDSDSSPCWLSSNGVEWAGSEDVSSLEYYEHNVGNLALVVFRQNWSSEVISVFLEDWEVGRVVLSLPLVNGPSMPRNEEMRVGRAQSLWILLAPCFRSAKEALWWNCHSSNAFFSPRDGL